MYKNLVTTLTVYLILIAVVVAGFFLLKIEQTAINYWAFGSIIFSFVVTLIVVILAVVFHKKGIVHTVGLTTLLLVYQILVIISVALTGTYEFKLNIFILIQICLNALFIVCLVLHLNATRLVLKSNEQIDESNKNGEFDKPKRGKF